MSLQTTQPLLLAALVGWGAMPGTLRGLGGPGRRLAPPCCKQENGRMKIARAGSRVILALSSTHPPFTHHL